MSFKRELNLLNEEQINGKNMECQLDVLSKYGYSAATTDLAIARGIRDVPETGEVYFDKQIHGHNSSKGIVGRYLINPLEKNEGYYYSLSLNNKDLYLNSIKRRDCGIRPVLKLPSSEFEQVSMKKTSGYNGTFEVEFGEYPQYAPNKAIQDALSLELSFNRLKETGNKYTFDGTRSDFLESPFEEASCVEYEYEGKKYIRVPLNLWYIHSVSKLSNDMTYVYPGFVWIEVSPVKWLIDEKSKTLISKNILLAGIRYPEVKDYLDNYMLKELFQTNQLTNINDTTLEYKKDMKTIEDKPKEKLVDLLRSLKESGLELTEKQEKIIQFADNKEIREKRQKEIRDNIALENKRKEELFNSPDDLSNIRLKQLEKIRIQVEMLKKVQQKNPTLLSKEQVDLIKYLDMIDLANSMPHEIDTGMNPEIRNWYSERYNSEDNNTKKR